MSSSSLPLHYKSYAKINLYLEIIGYNQKNYHLLDSLMAFIDLHDEITIKTSENLSLEVFGSYADRLSTQDNIILQTVKIMAKKYNFNPRIKIILNKNIPIGAGLGGGSANAATIIKMLNHLYKLNLSKAEMVDISLEIGSDIVFCLEGKTSLVSGIGENVKNLTINNQKDLFILIATPNKALITEKVYNLFKNKYQHLITKSKVTPVDGFDLINIIKDRHNHLQPPAIEIAPEIKQLIDDINNQQNCLISRMSGSGSACFGIFQNLKEVKSAISNLEKIYPNFYFKSSKIIHDILDD